MYVGWCVRPAGIGSNRMKLITKKEDETGSWKDRKSGKRGQRERESVGDCERGQQGYGVRECKGQPIRRANREMGDKKTGKRTKRDRVEWCERPTWILHDGMN